MNNDSEYPISEDTPHLTELIRFLSASPQEAQDMLATPSDILLAEQTLKLLKGRLALLEDAQLRQELTNTRSQQAPPEPVVLPVTDFSTVSTDPTFSAPEVSANPTFKAPSMAEVFQQMTPEQWEYMFRQVTQLSPENLDDALQMFQQQMGMPVENASQLRELSGIMNQLDPDKLSALSDQIAQFPPDFFEQISDFEAKFFSTQKSPDSASSFQIPGIAPLATDKYHEFLLKEIQQLPPLKSEQAFKLLGEGFRLTSQNDARAILDHYTQALGDFADSPTPYFRAICHFERARVQNQLLESDPRNLSDAGLADCEAALTVLTPTQTPYYWSHAHLLRGMFYAQRLNGVRDENLKLSVAAFDTILEYFSYEDLPMPWIMARGMRGMTMQEWYNEGLTTNVDQAIIDLETALEHLTYEQQPQFWAALKAVCTEAYTLRYMYSGDRSRTLEQIIRDCSDALKVVTFEHMPREWALLHQTRSFAYIDISSGDARQNRELAIADCHDALKVFTREFNARSWAVCHQYLGNAYLARIVGERPTNLREALQHYDLSLQVFTRETYPRDWATTIGNRTLAAQELGSGDRSTVLEEGIVNFAAVLEQIDPHLQPVAWATAHVNWGHSYLNRLQGERLANREEALMHYNQALTVFTAERQPMLWAMTLINRSMALRGLLPRELANLVMGDSGGSLQALFSLPFNKIANSLAVWHKQWDAALEDLQKALTVLTPERTPKEWAIAQRELGSTYEMCMWGDREENQRRAREHFALAQTIFSPTSTPQDWAIMRMNHGLGLIARLSSGQEADAHAILEHLNAALTVFTAQVAPARHRRVQLVRAWIFEYLKNWQATHEALIEARKVQRDLVAAAFSTQSQGDEIAEAAYTNMYVHDAQILLRMPQADPVEAVIALEEGRAQSLRATLEIDNYEHKMRHIRNPQAQMRLKAFLSARNTWRAYQHRAIESPPASLAPTEQSLRQQRLNQELENAYREFVQARAAIRENDEPDFMTPLPTLDGIARAVIASDEALVYLSTGIYISLGLVPVTQGRIVDGVEPGFALIVTRQLDGTPEVQSLSLPHFTTNALDMLLRPVDYKPDVEDAEVSIRVEMDLEKMVQNLGALGLNELAALLLARGIRRVMLVPYGRLGLFPLSAVRIELPKRPVSYLGELFEFTVVPGAYAATVARRRAQELSKKRQKWLIGGNPLPLAADHKLGDLPFATAEAETVYRLARRAGYSLDMLRHFAPHALQKAAVASEMQKVTCAYLAVHGIYNLETPRKSVLVLAGTEDVPEVQRTISLGEVLDGEIDLHNMRLLILSTCESSVFDVQRVPNEVIGLAMGFLQAGVAGVIASLWKVNDQATYLLMSRFASLYLDTQALWSPAQALAQAQHWLREEATYTVLQDYDPLFPGGGLESGPVPSQARYSHQEGLERIRKNATRRAQSTPEALPYAHPAFWAGFVVTGC